MKLSLCTLNQITLRLFFLSLISMSLSCSHLSFGKWFSDDNPETTDEYTENEDEDIDETNDFEGRPLKHKRKDSLELIVSRLHARVTQLEDMILAQKSALTLIRRTQSLGFRPEESLYEGNSGTAMNTSPKDASIQNMNSKSRIKIPEKDDSLSDKTAAEILAKADALFDSGNYGQAVNLYWQVEGKTENPRFRFQIALSWYRLKEFAISKYQFEEFLKVSQDRSRIAHSHYYLGLIASNSGFKERAIRKLQLVAKDYPNTNASELALRELQSLTSYQ